MEPHNLGFFFIFFWIFGTDWLYQMHIHHPNDTETQGFLHMPAPAEAHGFQFHPAHFCPWGRWDAGPGAVWFVGPFWRKRRSGGGLVKGSHRKNFPRSYRVLFLVGMGCDFGRIFLLKDLRPRKMNGWNMLEWTFGSWFAFSIGWLLGSMLNFRGVY